jgi:hypothetical protein
MNYFWAIACVLIKKRSLKPLQYRKIEFLNYKVIINNDASKKYVLISLW